MVTKQTYPRGNYLTFTNLGATLSTTVPVSPGSYTQRLRLSLANGKRANRDVTFTLTPYPNNLTYAVTYPSGAILFPCGAYYIDIRIAALRNVTAG